MLVVLPSARTQPILYGLLKMAVLVPRPAYLHTLQKSFPKQFSSPSYTQAPHSQMLLERPHVLHPWQCQPGSSMVPIPQNHTPAQLHLVCCHATASAQSRLSVLPGSRAGGPLQGREKLIFIPLSRVNNRTWHCMA